MIAFMAGFDFDGDIDRLAQLLCECNLFFGHIHNAVGAFGRVPESHQSDMIHTVNHPFAEGYVLAGNLVLVQPYG
ncbi:hypothetical protein D3C76_1847470 [compost metagenome]